MTSFKRACERLTLNPHKAASNEGRFDAVGVAMDPRSFYHFRTSHTKFIADKFEIKPSTVYANTKR